MHEQPDAALREAEALIQQIDHNATLARKAFGFDSQRRLMERAVIELHRGCPGCTVCSSQLFAQARAKSGSLGPESPRTGLAAQSIHSAQLLVAQAREALDSKDALAAFRLLNKAQQGLLAAVGHRLGIAFGQLEGAASASRRATAKKAAESRHDRPGGTRDKREQIRAIWASGKYATREICAEEEHEALDTSYSTARKALYSTPEPIRSEKQLSAASRRGSRRKA